MSASDQSQTGTDSTGTDSTGTDSTGTDSTGTDEKPTVAEIQADIEATRAELSDTVDALTAKMDVKGRTKQRLTTTKDQATAKAAELTGNARAAATDDQGKPKPAVLGGAGALAAVIVAGVVLLVWRKKK